MVDSNSRIPFVAMGATSMLLQIIVLRLLLSTFSGNELDSFAGAGLWPDPLRFTDSILQIESILYIVIAIQPGIIEQQK